MVITIKDENNRFGCRVAAMIFNKEKTKILMQKQGERDILMFPGGRLEVHEISEEAMVRELKEELGIDVSVNLKYISEALINLPHSKYHEIGFYFMVVIEDELSLEKEYTSLDVNEIDSIFKWIDINDLNSYNFMVNHIKQKIVSGEVFENNDLEHLVLFLCP